MKKVTTIPLGNDLKDDEEKESEENSYEESVRDIQYLTPERHAAEQLASDLDDSYLDQFQRHYNDMEIAAEEDTKTADAKKRHIERMVRKHKPSMLENLCNAISCTKIGNAVISDSPSNITSLRETSKLNNNPKEKHQE